MNTFYVINALTVIGAAVPWGMIPYGNIQLQKMGIAIQIVSLILMLANIALLVLYPELYGMQRVLTH